MGIITFIEVSIFLAILLLVGIFIRCGEILDILVFLKKDAQIKTLMGFDIPDALLDKMKSLNEKLKTLNDEKEESETET